MYHTHSSTNYTRMYLISKLSLSAIFRLISDRSNFRKEYGIAAGINEVAAEISRSNPICMESFESKSYLPNEIVSSSFNIHLSVYISTSYFEQHTN